MKTFFLGFGGAQMTEKQTRHNAPNRGVTHQWD